MVVVISDLIEYMNATGGPGGPYVFFRIFEITEAAVQQYLDEADEWCGEQISTATQTAEADLYDRLVTVDAALNVMKQIKLESIGVAFDYSTLGHSVNLGNAHKALEEGRQEYLKKKRQLLQQLQQGIEISPQNDWTTDYKNIVGYNIRTTASWH